VHLLVDILICYYRFVTIHNRLVKTTEALRKLNPINAVLRHKVRLSVWLIKHHHIKMWK
jgi:hypothetical protein